MAACRRRGVLAGLFLVAAASAGCDMKTMAYFLLPDAKDEAEVRRIASDDPRKEVKVAILTYGALEVRPEFIKADLQLSELLAKQLRELCEANDERVSIVQPRKVEAFKNTHPNWHTLDPAEVGQHFGADYVIYIEINSLAFYQPGTYRQFYQGKANLTLSLVNVRKPNDISSGPRELAFSYPSESRGGNVPVDSDTPPQVFRQKFLDYIGRQMAWQFTAHPTNQHHWAE